ncbi:MAG: sulfotransferase [Rhodobacteraceae bacterium]|nr:sulfotransferase [Paracoccaceae bacterium]
MKIAKREQKAGSRNPMPWNIAGICLSQQGKLQDAISQFQRALKIAPDFIDARHNLAQTLILAGRANQVPKVLEKHSAKDPKACYFLAQAYMQEGDIQAAETFISRAIELSAKFAPAYNLRALLRGGQGQEKAALRDLETALQIDPNNVEALVNISLPLARQNRHADSRQAVERAVALDPSHIGALLRLGMSQVEAGEFEAAVQRFRSVLDLQPHNAQAFEQLSLVLDHDAVAALEPAIRKALTKARSGTAEIAELNFALSRAADAKGDKQTAAKARAKANATLAKLHPYDPEADSQQTRDILARFPVAPPSSPTETEAPHPIYVLGLPRSGTSLVEAMLARHPKVTAMGERAATGFLLQDLIEKNLPFDSKAITRFVEGDKDFLPACPDGTSAYVDKMPENYRYIGFLRAAYPDAKFIHVKRDPRDVALSMWKSHFSGRALSYTYDLGAMAHRFGLYAQFMTRWTSLYPDAILTVNYEELVSDPTAASQKLAQFCGLDWIDDMVSPEKSDLPTLTMSASQIRKPIHRSSVGTWTSQSDELAPFLDALDDSYWRP